MSYFMLIVIVYLLILSQ
ncbi:hypothetical protein PFDG_04816 [Plasmodium falciparum Dd2]|uniref:Uncharacterized protein n=1 Tax=Plasmodium falciparum (isolate Dd2) TaxID=57267 RepID=A0A0L7M8Y2_PLAF4|nr:hypothetical protein PFDG_04816 [Plasmodium falciparum Dd2]